jgi:hypothetical protein
VGWLGSPTAHVLDPTTPCTVQATVPRSMSVPIQAVLLSVFRRARDPSHLEDISQGHVHVMVRCLRCCAAFCIGTHTRTRVYGFFVFIVPLTRLIRRCVYVFALFWNLIARLAALDCKNCDSTVSLIRVQGCT